MMRTARPRARRLVLGLLMSTALSTMALTQPAFAQSERRAYDAFASSRYNYCDAKLLGAFYGLGPDGGKVEIGRKIINGIGTNVPVVLDEARNAGHACEWADTGFSYRDARVLASVWGYDEPYEAKLRAAELFTWGQARQVESALGV